MIQRKIWQLLRKAKIMSEHHPISDLMTETMSKIKEMVDVNTVVGDPIQTPDGTVLIPVSKISYGFAAGGSNIPSKTQAELFGGGSGAGINITPIAFIAVNDGGVQVLPIVSKPDTGDKMVNLVPEMFDKVTSLFNKKKETAETVEVKTKETADGSSETSAAVTTVTAAPKAESEE